MHSRARVRRSVPVGSIGHAGTMLRLTKPRSGIPKTSQLQPSALWQLSAMRNRSRGSGGRRAGVVARATATTLNGTHPRRCDGCSGSCDDSCRQSSRVRHPVVPDLTSTAARGQPSVSAQKETLSACMIAYAPLAMVIQAEEPGMQAARQ